MTILHVPFLQTDIIAIARHNGRPMVLIEPLCKTLGIDPTAQVKRCHQQAETANLATAVIWGGANSWTGIPLEDLSWFLRTLRPRDERVQRTLDVYRRHAPWAVIEYWLQHNGRFMPGRTAQKLLRDIPHKPAPRKSAGNGLTSRIHAEDVVTMQRLREEGQSLQQIANRFGISKATTSLCLSGKYMVNPNPRPSIAENSRCINNL